MERLTYYSMKGSENDGWYLNPGISHKKAIEKLAAYENTGLTPDEIERLKAERDAAVEDNNQLKDENTKWGEYVAHLNSLLDKRDAEIAELRSRLEKSDSTPDKKFNFSTLSYSELCAFLERHPEIKEHSNNGKNNNN